MKHEKTTIKIPVVSMVVKPVHSWVSEKIYYPSNHGVNGK